MEWVSPTTDFNAGEMPTNGVLPMDWTDNPGASDYGLTVITPNGSPVDYDVDGSSKDLFLENYAQDGTYQVTVTALDAYGNALCSISMLFEMNHPIILDPKHSGDGSSDGDGGDSQNSNPPLIILLPYPTEAPPVP